MVQLEVDDGAALYTLPDEAYPAGWQQPALLANKKLGDRWMAEKAFLGIWVRSAVNELEYNCLLNPLFPRFYDWVKVISATEIVIDSRLKGA